MYSENAKLVLLETIPKVESIEWVITTNAKGPKEGEHGTSMQSRIVPIYKGILHHLMIRLC
jgi:hypothetical protein